MHHCLWGVDAPDDYDIHGRPNFMLCCDMECFTTVCEVADFLQTY